MNSMYGFDFVREHRFDRHAIMDCVIFSCTKLNRYTG